MGKAKVVNYCNERYSGTLTQEVCDLLEQLIELDSDNGCIPDLRHIIFELNNSDVTEIIEQYEAFGTCISDIEKKVGTLRDEQTIGVAFMYYARNCLLGDSVGLGKTVQTAGLINLLKSDYAKNGREFRYLVLTEKNLAVQFRKELVKFTGDFVGLLPSGEQNVLDKFTANRVAGEPLPWSYVGTHALLTAPKFLSWFEQSRQLNDVPFDLLVIDESSCLGNTTTGIYKSFKAISKYFKRVIFLNATPFETKLEIFYNQLNALDPDLMPTKTNFTQEYCIMDRRGMYPKPTGKYKNQSSFRKLIGYRYFARTRAEKGAVMEDCHGGIRLSPLSPIQKEWLNKSQLSRVVYDCPSHLDPSIEFNIENVPKLGSLKELLTNDCAEADSILIFAHFKEAQACLSEWLTKQGYSNRVLNGDTKNSVRSEITEGFKNKEYQILITSVQKGLNFGDCNYCIFYGFDPNPSSMIQFEGRTTRSFDIIGKNVYILCSMGKEYKQLHAKLRSRTVATTEMSKTDLSVVLSILLGDMSDVSSED